MTSAAAQIAKTPAPSRVAERLMFAWRAALDELAGRFRSSLFGGLWLALGPVLLLVVYWAVFDAVLGIEFTNPVTGEKVPFLAAFAVGFFLYLGFSELVSGSASWFKTRRRLIVETDLPLWSIFAILVFRTFVQYLFYIAATTAICAYYGLADVPGALAYIGAALIIFVVFCGVSLAVGLLGAFFGDIREIMPMLMRVLFYVSSITFPLSAIPSSLQWLPNANPQTWAVEISRSLMLWGAGNAFDYAAGLLIAGAIFWAAAILLYWRLAGVVDQVV